MAGAGCSRKTKIYYLCQLFLCYLHCRTRETYLREGEGGREGDGSFISAKLCEVFFTSCWRQSAFVTIKQRLKLWKATWQRIKRVRERERGAYLAAARVALPLYHSPVCLFLPRGHVDVDVDMARLGPFSSLLIAWPAGAHLSCTRLSLSLSLSLPAFGFGYSTLFFGTDFPRTLWAVYDYDVDVDVVARCHRQFSVSSVLP